ncbi:hypothetical protein LWI28_015346 [Acer negundo]|uniref:Uncharacterized protein n=1 Tax=Acer negundo TaxID=4023 RepID=A0AAD5P4D1_ACENE|nr:hypothetical protein LWI28_015346 [Acer negundo]
MTGQFPRNGRPSLSNTSTPAAAALSHSLNGAACSRSHMPHLMKSAPLSDVLPLESAGHFPTGLSLPAISSSCFSAHLPTDNPALGSIPSHHPMITRSKNGIFKPKAFSLSTFYLVEIVPIFAKIALQDLRWSKAMNGEFGALQANGTWSLVPFTICALQYLSNTIVGVEFYMDPPSIMGVKFYMDPLFLVEVEVYTLVGVEIRMDLASLVEVK